MNESVLSSVYIKPEFRSGVEIRSLEHDIEHPGAVLSIPALQF